MRRTKAIKERYYKACRDIAKEFCKKHDCEYDEDFWVANKIGGILCTNEMFVSMDSMIYDTFENIPKNVYFMWYYDSLDACERGESFPNYENYCKINK